MRQPSFSCSFYYLFKSLTCSDRHSFVNSIRNVPNVLPVGKVMIQVKGEKSCAGKIKPSSLHRNFTKCKPKIGRIPSGLRANGCNIRRRIYVNNNVIALRMPKHIDQGDLVGPGPGH